MGRYCVLEQSSIKAKVGKKYSPGVSKKQEKTLAGRARVLLNRLLDSLLVLNLHVLAAVGRQVILKVVQFAG